MKISKYTMKQIIILLILGFGWYYIAGVISSIVICVLYLYLHHKTVVSPIFTEEKKKNIIVHSDDWVGTIDYWNK